MPQNSYTTNVPRDNTCLVGKEFRNLKDAIDDIKGNGKIFIYNDFWGFMGGFVYKDGVCCGTV